MFDIILLFIIFIALIVIIIQKSEKMTDHNFKYLNSKSSIFVKNNLYSNNEQIEITTLPTCTLNIKYDYGSNFNLIINNDISIYQNIIDPLEHTIELDNLNYNLTSISWKLSKFRYNDINVGLDLYLTHQNFNSLHKLIIVIPLSLTSNKIKPFTNEKETFKNVGYKKMSKDLLVYTDTKIYDNSDKNFLIPAYFNIKNKTNLLIQSQKNLYDLKIKRNDTKFSLDKLITSPVLIPKYECCTDSIGQNIRFNFCDVQQLLSDNTKFYQLEDKEANKYFISDPIEFDEELGLTIMNNLSYDTSILFLKK